MAQRPPQPSTLADRVLEVVRDLLAAREPETTEPTGTLDELARVAERSLARWIEERRRSRPRRERTLDQVAAVGRPIELEVRMDDDLGGEVEVEFFVDGVRAGAATTSDLGVAVCAFQPATAGLHVVTTRLHDPAGGDVPEPRPAAVLQVVGDAPVVLADARLLDRHTPGALAPLRALIAAGAQLCWAEPDELDRVAARRDQLAAADLPAAAVLAVAARELDFETLGVDFGPVSTRLLVRRLRASGVPLVLVVTAAATTRRVPVPGVAVVTLGELAARLDAPAYLAAVLADAAAFVAARDRAVGPAALARRLDLMTGTHAVAGNAVELELDNRAARQALFADLARADHSIHLQFYMLEAGRFATELCALLQARAQAGVAVRLVVDALYAGHDLLGRSNPVLDELTDRPGIEILASDPVTFEHGLDTLALKQRDHRKLAIIDGEIAYVTGRNGADPYYLGFDEVDIDDNTVHDAIPWLDAHARLRGPLVDELQRIFLANWERNGGAVVTVEDAAAPRPPPHGDVAARVILHDGTGDALALAAYDALFAGARERLIVVNDFPIIADLATRLIGAAQRGVRVDVLTGNGLTRRGDGSFFPGPRYRELFEYMVKRCYEPLLRAGIHVAEYVAPELPNITATGGAIRPYVHAKVVVADGCIASVGTANLDVTASHWEREVNLVIESRPVAAALTAQLDALLARAYPLDPTSEYWRREAARRALASRLWPERLYS